MGEPYTVTALIVIALGGFGSVTGSLLGGLLLGVVEAIGMHLTSPSLKTASRRLHAGVDHAPQRALRPLMPRRALAAVAGGAAVAAALPWLVDDFLVSLALSCLMYTSRSRRAGRCSPGPRAVSLGTSAGVVPTRAPGRSRPRPGRGHLVVVAAVARPRDPAARHVLRGPHLRHAERGHPPRCHGRRYAGVASAACSRWSRRKHPYFTVLAIAQIRRRPGRRRRTGGSRFGLALIGIARRSACRRAG